MDLNKNSSENVFFKHPETHVLKKHRILIVEDNTIICLMESRLLERWGYDTVSAVNGEDAVEIVKKDLIDLVLMDVNLGSGIDGFEAAGRIIKIADIPIIFLTSHELCEVIDRISLMQSYTAHVMKDGNVNHILAAVERALDLYSYKKKVSLSGNN